jgi:hypothetical protein
MRQIPALLVLFVSVWFAAAQEPKAQPKSADKLPAKPNNAEPVPGRKLKKIEGFNFLLSEEAAGIDPAKYKLPPLEALERECKAMTRAFSPKVLDLFRKLTIWVEWDMKVPSPNRRPGTALAVYYPDTPQQSVAAGRHALQAKSITICSLKTLTECAQPDNDSGDSATLLHEFVHAVHDQLLGFNHADIKAMYEQAMERRLYEKDLYAATNHIEFFAELSCAYLDRLSYYPHNRADLKKLDPFTFKVLETVWAGAKSTGAAAPRHSAKVTLDVSLPADVQFGKVVLGKVPEADKLSGKVVLVGYWGGDFTNVLNRMDRLSSELADYGLVVVCPYAYMEKREKIKEFAEKRGVSVPVIEVAWVKEPGAKEAHAPPGGHAMVFGPDGKCVYRGSAYDADDPVRTAIGKLLLNAAVGAEAAPKLLKPIADAFAAGGSPVAVYSKVAALLGSTDADTKAAAKELADLILAPGRKAFDDAQAIAKTDPVGAFFAAEKIAAGFKNTPVAAKANSLIEKLRSNNTVGAELKARKLAAEVERLAGKLRGQEGSFNPSDPVFQRNNQQALDLMKTLIGNLRKQYPTARATSQADAAGREFGLP